MKTDIYGFTDEGRKWMDEIFFSIPHIEKVILYGSRAKGNFREFSDVDIILIGDKLTHDDLLELYDKLYESDLPYKYDISIFSKLEDKDFIEHIKRVGKFIFSRAECATDVPLASDKVAEQQP